MRGISGSSSGSGLSPSGEQALPQCTQVESDRQLAQAKLDDSSDDSDNDDDDYNPLNFPPSPEGVAATTDLS